MNVKFVPREGAPIELPNDKEQNMGVRLLAHLSNYKNWGKTANDAYSQKEAIEKKRKRQNRNNRDARKRKRVMQLAEELGESGHSVALYIVNRKGDKSVFATEDYKDCVQFNFQLAAQKTEEICASRAAAEPKSFISQGPHDARVRQMFFVYGNHPTFVSS